MRKNRLPTILLEERERYRLPLIGREFHYEPSIRESLKEVLYHNLIENPKRGLAIVGTGLLLLAGLYICNEGKKLEEWKQANLPPAVHSYEPSLSEQVQEKPIIYPELEDIVQQ